MDINEWVMSQFEKMVGDNPILFSDFYAKIKEENKDISEKELELITLNLNLHCIRVNDEPLKLAKKPFQRFPKNQNPSTDIATSSKTRVKMPPNSKK